MADDGHRAAVEQRNAAQDTRILLALPVAALHKEILKQRADIVIDLHPARMTRQQHALLRSQVAAPGEQGSPPDCQRLMLFLAACSKRRLHCIEF